MKKLLALVLALVMAVALCACESGGASSEQAPENKSSNESKESAASKVQEKEYNVSKNTVLFKLTESEWAKKIYVHYWSDSKKNYNMVKWPGDQMEPIDDDVYSFELPEGVDHIIFDDNKYQTEDIPYDGSVQKYMLSSEKDSKGKYYVETWDGTRIETAVGAGGEYENDTEEAKAERISKAAAYVENTLGTNAMAKYKKSDGGGTMSFSWDIDKSDKPEQKMPFDVTFDGVTVKSGTKVSDLTSKGFSLQEEDKTIDANEALSTFYCENNSTNRNVGLTLANKTGESKKAVDCDIIGINFERNCNEVDYQGVTNGKTLEEVIKALDLPVQGVLIGCVKGQDPTIELQYGTPTKGTASIELLYNVDDNKATVRDIKVDEAY